MDIFSIEIPVEFPNGLKAWFRSPKNQEVAWAIGWMNRFRSTDHDTPEQAELVSTELPDKLSVMAVRIEPPVGHELPEHWKAGLHDSGLLSGMSGLEVLQQVCFQSHVKPSAKGAA